jgi:hypothetical protein
MREGEGGIGRVAPDPASKEALRYRTALKAEIAKRQTASTHLHRFEAAGILQEKQTGLNKLFLNSRFLKLLTQEPDDYKRFGSR